jgi:hypothetical protein
VVLTSDVGGVTVLLGGDLETAAQDAVLASGIVRHVDVVKVPHHGSAKQAPGYRSDLEPGRPSTQSGYGGGRWDEVSGGYGMADYDLDRLGAGEFENLTQALAVKVLGPGVHVFGLGPDGGREATFEGRIDWSPSDADLAWEGYTVIQAKHHHRPTKTRADTGWLIDQLKVEFQKWERNRSKTKRKSRMPEYFIVATNVAPSSVPEVGGQDALDRLMAEWCGRLGVRGWRVWHYDYLCRLLDDSYDIRRAYSGLVMPGDVLSHLLASLDADRVDLADVMTRQAARELVRDQWLRLSQAGSRTTEKLALSFVAVDLPASRVDAEVSRQVEVLDEILRVGNEVLRPSVTRGTNPHLVLVGGPGQGKSTVSQLICQTYRLALLGQQHDSADVQTVVSGLLNNVARIGARRANMLRWPFLIELRAYADAVAGGESLSILRYIAQQVTARGSDSITAAQVRTWLSDWPWLLVLDGLDEIASPAVRGHVMQLIDDFLVEAQTVDADLLVVATSRPLGYAGEFTPDRYSQLDLDDLNVDRAIAYADRLADIRLSDDPDMCEQVKTRVREAATEDATARLMRSPLQVTIMSLLLEARLRVPRARYALFDAYYDTIYAREVGKGGAIGRLLEEGRADIDAIHERVGFDLQCLSEQVGESDAAISEAALLGIADDRLKSEGHLESQAGPQGRAIVEAATQRLVLVVPKGDSGFGFEVRSLQEFMAARAVASGEDQRVLARLRLMVPSAHWRNTWLLAAGRVFSQREHLRAGVLGLLTEVDSIDQVHRAVSAGASLAIDLLADDIASTSPQHLRMLTIDALRCLDFAPDWGIRTRAPVLVSAAEQDTIAREDIERAITRTLASNDAAKLTALVLLREWSQRPGALPTRSQQLLAGSDAQISGLQQSILHLSLARGPGDTVTASAPAVGRTNLGSLLRKRFNRAAITAQDRAILGLLLAEFKSSNIVRYEVDGEQASLVTMHFYPNQEVLSNALDRESIRALMASTATQLELKTWSISSSVRQVLSSWLTRKPVGAELARLT